MTEHIQVYNPSSGKPYATAPTPKNTDGSINLSDNSNKVTTTEWVNSKKFVQTINTKEPDSNGNVNIPTRNVGDEWFSYTGKIPAGGVPYCGQTVTRETYSDLWNYVQNNNLVKTESEWQELNTSQNGNVPYYSSGDGSSTFRMPKIVGYIKGADGVDGVGTYTVEGLPNITGLYTKTASYGGYDQGTYTGALYKKSTANKTNLTGGSGSQSDTASWGFDASKSNSIYGNSIHVTPETTTILFGVYAYGELTVTGSTTTDAIATGLANVEAHIRVETMWKSSDGLSWYRKWTDGWIEQGGTFSNTARSTAITFPKAFTTTTYQVQATVAHCTTSWTSTVNTGVQASTKTKTGVTLMCWFDSSNTTGANDWYACGY